MPPLAPTPFIEPTAEGIAHAARLLEAGQLVAVPTETVYGLAASACNVAAVGDIFRVKGRPLIDPLIVHVSSPEAAEACAELPKPFAKLAEAFWPGPLTLVLPRRPVIPDIVTAGNPTVALRCPAHPVLRKLLAQCQLPLAAPSANPFGYISPTTAEHVRDSLGERCPHILQGGPCEHGLESTILNLSGECPEVLRPGPISLEALGEVLGQPVSLRQQAAPATARVDAPGLLARHYSPHTRVLAFAQTLPESTPEDAWVWQQRPSETQAALPGQHHWLSEKGDLHEAASHFFALLRQLDDGQHARLLVQRAPHHGLGLAFNDRLQRAANR